jgi:hypothetical protein
MWPTESEVVSSPPFTPFVCHFQHLHLQLPFGCFYNEPAPKYSTRQNQLLTRQVNVDNKMIKKSEYGMVKLILNSNNSLKTLYSIKAIPLQAWRGPQGSRRLRFPEFPGNWHMKAARLSAY